MLFYNKVKFTTLRLLYVFMKTIYLEMFNSLLTYMQFKNICNRNHAIKPMRLVCVGYRKCGTVCMILFCFANFFFFFFLIEKNFKISIFMKPCTSFFPLFLTFPLFFTSTLCLCLHGLLLTLLLRNPSAFCDGTDCKLT